jgi:hypothetical protein
MERPGRPRAALGNSPARASKNRLGCATLVLQITPANQAVRTAARTEHPSIPIPQPAGRYHGPGPRHGPTLTELPRRPRTTAQHEPPGADADAPHLFCKSRRPTKQQARRHGRSVLQHPAHCPQVANTAWAGNTDAGTAARTASVKSQAQASRSRPLRAVHLQSEYGMGSRKYMLCNRWKRARKGLLQQGAVGTAAGNPELTGCFGTI